MASKVEIINMVHGHLGQAIIETSLSGDIREATRKVLMFADTAKDLVLSDHDWKNATMDIELQPLSGVVAGRWTHVYGLPEGFLRASVIDVRTDWEVGLVLKNGVPVRAIKSMAALSWAKVVVSVPWDVLPLHLMLATSLKIAELACNIVTGKVDKVPSLREAYAAALLDAARVESYNHGVDQPDIQGYHLYRRLAV
ncbi:hypothetical protein [Asticcacaulis excentricus]|uniref:Uncharacterized protein n=1 Tax=Asticcacaulis excentricus TaxID=78587 RepID=A0A3G9G6N5_9CAUL|nr:hypothetical protein [Asticcacaulis excentricus]BBF79918.1 hypothetical protein EM6_0495 [Asticcacaulis excentricus]